MLFVYNRYEFSEEKCFQLKFTSKTLINHLYSCQLGTGQCLQKEKGIYMQNRELYDQRN